jgi:hypothetical protein
MKTARSKPRPAAASHPDGSAGTASRSIVLNGYKPSRPVGHVFAPLSTPWTVARQMIGELPEDPFNGWMLLYDDLRQPPTDDLIGELCVVAVKGAILVKTLQRSEVEGRFDLISLSGPPIRNVEITWAAPVKAIFRPDP